MNNELIASMIESWNQPSTRHAMLVHMPIVLAMLGVPMAVLVAILPRRIWPRVMAVVLFALLFVSSWFAYESGLDAEGRIGASITAAGNEVLSTHKSLGGWIRWFAAGAAVVLLVGFARDSRVRHSASVVTVLASLLIVGWVTVTGHYGGILVYDHGLGVAQATSGTQGARGTETTGESDGADGTDPQSITMLDPRVVYFRDTVRPILENRCWGCHNPVRASDNGELDLTSMAAIIAANEAAGLEKIITPGDPSASMLTISVSYEDPFLQMPPTDQGPLSEAEVDALNRWVLDGAVWHDAAATDDDWRAAMETVDRDKESSEKNGTDSGNS